MAAPLEVDESIAPIFIEDNKEVIMEYLCLCQSCQVVAPMCLPLPHAEQVLAKKKKTMAPSPSIEEDEDVTTITNEDTKTPLRRKKR